MRPACYRVCPAVCTGCDSTLVWDCTGLATSRTFRGFNNSRERAPHCCCRALRAVLPTHVAKPCQPPNLARPCQLGPADDFPPDTSKGAYPIGRLRITARLTAYQAVHISCESTNSIAPTWSAVQLSRPVGGRAGCDYWIRRGRQWSSPGSARRLAISFSASCQLLGAA